MKRLKEAALVVLVLLILAGVLTPGIGRPRETVSRATCYWNLRQIGLTLAMYSSEQYYGTWPKVAGKHPAELLYDNGNGIIGDPKAFLCPVRRRMGTEADDGSFRCDYYIRTDIPADAVANTIVACDLPGNHNDGGNVLFKDGHAGFFSCTPGEYAGWFEDFMAGDPRARLGIDAWREGESGAFSSTGK